MLFGRRIAITFIAKRLDDIPTVFAAASRLTLAQELIAPAAEQNFRLKLEIAVDDRSVISPGPKMGHKRGRAGVINRRRGDEPDAHALSFRYLHGGFGSCTIGTNTHSAKFGLAAARHRGGGGRRFGDKGIG